MPKRRSGSSSLALRLTAPGSSSSSSAHPQGQSSSSSSAFSVGRSVSTVKQCFAWQPHVFVQAACLASAMTYDPEVGCGSVSDNIFMSFLETFACAWIGMTFSTCFSGIGSPDNACHFINCFLSCKLGKDIHGMQNIWGCEKDKLARAELLLSPSAPWFAQHMGTHEHIRKVNS